LADYINIFGGNTAELVHLTR